MRPAWESLFEANLRGTSPNSATSNGWQTLASANGSRSRRRRISPRQLAASRPKRRSQRCWKSRSIPLATIITEDPVSKGESLSPNFLLIAKGPLRKRVSANLLKRAALENAVGSIEPQKSHGYLSDLRARLDHGLIQPEVLPPIIYPRVEQPDELLLRANDRANIRAFRAIAAFARQRQIRRTGNPVVFAANDVVHLASGKQFNLRHQAILATETRAGSHLAPLSRTDFLSHAPCGNGPLPWRGSEDVRAAHIRSTRISHPASAHPPSLSARAPKRAGGWLPTAGSPSGHQPESGKPETQPLHPQRA